MFASEGRKYDVTGNEKKKQLLVIKLLLVAGSSERKTKNARQRAIFFPFIHF